MKTDMRLAFWHYDIETYREKRGFWLPEEIFSVGQVINKDKDFINFFSKTNADKRIKLAADNWQKILNENTQEESLEKTISKLNLELLK